MSLKLLTRKNASLPYSSRLLNTILRNNNKEQYLRASNISFRFSSTIHPQFYIKTPVTFCLSYRNKPRYLSPTYFTRTVSSFPPSRFYSPSQKALNKIIALGGAVLTFVILKPTLLLIINGAVAYGTYKLLKGFLDRLFPTGSIQFSTTQLTTNQRTLLVDNLHSKSIEQIKKANLNYDIYGFSDPHSISFKSAGFSSIDERGQNHQQQNTVVNIEYWAIGSSNHKEGLVKVEGVLHNYHDVVIKNIEIYWPKTRQTVKIGPTEKKQDWQNYRKPPIIEAEFRDVD